MPYFLKGKNNKQKKSKSLTQNTDIYKDHVHNLSTHQAEPCAAEELQDLEEDRVAALSSSQLCSRNMLLPSSGRLNYHT